MKKGLSRRNLFKYMGAGGAATVAAACDQKPEKLIPMLVPPTNFEYTPQTAYQYMTTSVSYTHLTLPTNREV